MRWVAVVLGLLFAAGAGLLVGYARWGRPAAEVGRVEQRLQETSKEAATLRQQKQDLDRQLEQVTKEQERLAQENEILRKQRTTEQILSGQSGELPTLPPK